MRRRRVMSYESICANAVSPLVAVRKEDDRPPETNATKTCDGGEQGIPPPTNQIQITKRRNSKHEK